MRSRTTVSSARLGASPPMMRSVASPTLASRHNCVVTVAGTSILFAPATWDVSLAAISGSQSWLEAKKCRAQSDMLQTPHWNATCTEPHEEHVLRH